MTAPPLKARLSAGARPPRAASAVRTLARTETIMPMKPAAPERIAPITKPIAASQPSGRREADDDRKHDRDDGDGRVLTLEEGHGAFLDRGGDRLHSLVAGRLGKHPKGQRDAVKYGERAANETGYDRCLCGHSNPL